MGDPLVAATWTIGNAADDTGTTRGWLVGHFIDPTTGGPRSSTDVEVKWGIHPPGDKRAEWTADDQRTTLVLLVDGDFTVHLTEGAAPLKHQGDYVMWGPGVDHSWEAHTHSVVITVRWPSATS
jgi:hypothetical protein